MAGPKKHVGRSGRTWVQIALVVTCGTIAVAQTPPTLNGNLSDFEALVNQIGGTPGIRAFAINQLDNYADQNPVGDDGFCDHPLGNTAVPAVFNRPMYSPINVGNFIVLYVPDSDGIIDPPAQDNSWFAVGVNIANGDGDVIGTNCNKLLVPPDLPSWVMVPFDCDGDGDPGQLGIGAGSRWFPQQPVSSFDEVKDAMNFEFRLGDCNDTALLENEFERQPADIRVYFEQEYANDTRLRVFIHGVELPGDPPTNFDVQCFPPNHSTPLSIKNRGLDFNTAFPNGRGNDDMEFYIPQIDWKVTNALYDPGTQTIQQYYTDFIRWEMTRLRFFLRSESSGDLSAEDVMQTTVRMALPEIEVTKHVRCQGTNPADPNTPWQTSVEALPGSVVDYRIQIDNPGDSRLDVSVLDRIECLCDIARTRPVTRCVVDGGNGVCNTTATGDDIQVVPVGQGVVQGGVVILPGPDGLINSPLAGDDQTVQTTMKVLLYNGSDGGTYLPPITITFLNAGQNGLDPAFFTADNAGFLRHITRECGDPNQSVAKRLGFMDARGDSCAGSIRPGDRIEVTFKGVIEYAADPNSLSSFCTLCNQPGAPSTIDVRNSVAVFGNYPVIRDGGNGLVQTSKLGDDIQVAPAGQTVVPGSVIILAGANGVINTVPSGDDFIAQLQVKDEAGQVDTPAETALGFDDNQVETNTFCRNVTLLKEARRWPDGLFASSATLPLAGPYPLRLEYRYTVTNSGELAEDITLTDDFLCADVAALAGVDFEPNACALCQGASPHQVIDQIPAGQSREYTCLVRIDSVSALLDLMNRDNIAGHTTCRNPGDPNDCYRNCARVTATANPAGAGSACYSGLKFETTSYADVCLRDCSLDVTKKVVCVGTDAGGQCDPNTPSGTPADSIQAVPNACVRFDIEVKNTTTDVPPADICRLRVRDQVVGSVTVDPAAWVACTVEDPNGTLMCTIPQCFKVDNTDYIVDLQAPPCGPMQQNWKLKARFTGFVPPNTPPGTVTNNFSAFCALYEAPTCYSFTNTDADDASVTIWKPALSCTKRWSVLWDSNGDCQPGPGFLDYASFHNLGTADGGKAVVFPAKLCLQMTVSNDGNVPLSTVVTDDPLVQLVNDPNIPGVDFDTLATCELGTAKTIQPGQDQVWNCCIRVDTAESLRQMAASDGGTFADVFENTASAVGTLIDPNICAVDRTAKTSCSANLVVPPPCAFSVTKLVKCAGEPDAAYRPKAEALPGTRLNYRIQVHNDSATVRLPMLCVTDTLCNDPNANCNCRSWFDPNSVTALLGSDIVTNCVRPTFRVDGQEACFTFAACRPGTPWLATAETLTIVFDVVVPADFNAGAGANCAPGPDPDCVNRVSVRGYTEACIPPGTPDRPCTTQPPQGGEIKAEINVLVPAVACDKKVCIDFDNDGICDTVDQSSVQLDCSAFPFTMFYKLTARNVGETGLTNVRVCDNNLVSQAIAAGLTVGTCELCDHLLVQQPPRVSGEKLATGRERGGDSLSTPPQRAVTEEPLAPGCDGINDNCAALADLLACNDELTATCRITVPDRAAWLRFTGNADCYTNAAYAEADARTAGTSLCGTKHVSSLPQPCQTTVCVAPPCNLSVVKKARCLTSCIGGTPIGDFTDDPNSPTNPLALVAGSGVEYQVVITNTDGTGFAPHICALEIQDCLTGPIDAIPGSAQASVFNDANQPVCTFVPAGFNVTGCPPGSPNPFVIDLPATPGCGQPLASGWRLELTFRACIRDTALPSDVIANTALVRGAPAQPGSDPNSWLCPAVPVFCTEPACEGSDDFTTRIKRRGLTCEKEWKAEWDSDSNCTPGPGLAPGPTANDYISVLDLRDVTFPAKLTLRLSAHNTGEVSLDVTNDIDLTLCNCVNSGIPGVSFVDPNSCELCIQKTKTIPPGGTATWSCQILVQSATAMRALADCDGLANENIIVEPLVGGAGMANTTAQAGSDDVQVVLAGQAVGPGDVIVVPGPNGILATAPVPDDVIEAAKLFRNTIDITGTTPCPGPPVPAEASATIIAPPPCAFTVTKDVKCLGAPDTTYGHRAEAGPGAYLTYRIRVNNTSGYTKLPQVCIADTLCGAPSCNCRGWFDTVSRPVTATIGQGGAQDFVTNCVRPTWAVDGTPVCFTFGACRPAAPWIAPGETLTITFDVHVPVGFNVAGLDPDCTNLVHVEAYTDACPTTGPGCADGQDADAEINVLVPRILCSRQVSADYANDGSLDVNSGTQIELVPDTANFPMRLIYSYEVRNVGELPLDQTRMCDQTLVAAATAVGATFGPCLIDPVSGCADLGTLPLAPMPGSAVTFECEVLILNDVQLEAFFAYDGIEQPRDCLTTTGVASGIPNYGARCAPPQVPVSSPCLASVCNGQNCPPLVRVQFLIWNPDEVSFSGPDRCIWSWDQRRISLYALGSAMPNFFQRNLLQADRGRARIDGIGSPVFCGSESIATPLLGLEVKILDTGAGRVLAGAPLPGAGNQAGQVKVWSPIPPPPPEQGRGNTRGSTTQKGSLLVYPNVEIKWNAAGQLIQDTFIHLANDGGDEVHINLLLVNGDPGLCNFQINDFDLTQNEATYWSALTGMPKGVLQFSELDPPVGSADDDPDNLGGTVLRGYLIAWATNGNNEEIRWNHLYGTGVVVNYAQTTTWAYEPWAFQAVTSQERQTLLDPLGQLDLNGLEYDYAPDQLLFEFFVPGAVLSSPDGRSATVTDTVLILWAAQQDFTNR